MSVWNKDWRYTPSVRTDIRKAFAKERARLKAKAEQDKRNEAEAQRKVASLHGR